MIMHILRNAKCMKENSRTVIPFGTNVIFRSCRLACCWGFRWCVRFLRWVAGLLIPDVSKECTYFFFKGWEVTIPWNVSIQQRCYSA